MVGQAPDHIGEPGPRIDEIELGGLPHAFRTLLCRWQPWRDHLSKIVGNQELRYALPTRQPPVSLGVLNGSKAAEVSYPCQSASHDPAVASQTLGDLNSNLFRKRRIFSMIFQ